MARCGPEVGLLIALPLCLIVVFRKIEIKLPNLLGSKGAKDSFGYLPDLYLKPVVQPGKEKCHIWEGGMKTGEPWLTQSYTMNEYKFKMEFKRVVQYTKTKHKNIEGHSADSPELTRMYLSIVNTSSFIRTVCETGFNAGHSSLSWLTGNVHTHVYSFDLGKHQYSRPMATYLQAVFPGRLKVTWGDSNVTIPAFTKQHPDVQCDLIVVDGGHSYFMANADLSNFRHLASKVHLLIVDDYHNKPIVKKAWIQNVKSGKVQEFFRCATSDSPKGFVVGRYSE